VRERPRDAFDVRRERRVVLDVIQRVLADDVDDARSGFLRVVQVRRRVGEAGAQVEERGGRRIGHAVITVGRAAAHAFEEPQHATHAFDAIERADEMHLGSAGIGEADIHPASQQCSNQTFCAVHVCFLCNGLTSRWTYPNHTGWDNIGRKAVR
jgi:hypothetical protein